jgi:putative transposase
MLAVNDLASQVGMEAACRAFAFNPGYVYRDRARRHGVFSRHPVAVRPRPPLAFSTAEQDNLLGVLDSERFADTAPAAIYATLLDEGHYHGSVRTMYRLLAAQSLVGDRRRQRRHPVYTKPELLAIRPNEVWSWDISKLKGPVKWTCFHLYVILDIFSRYVVGWMIAHRETAELAEQLIADTIDKQNIVPGTLTLHADRGTSMRSKSVAQLLVDLDVTKTHSRPHVSDDNPYSEAQFKTLKYRPDFPARFGSIEGAGALPRVLPLVQHCASSLWYRIDAARHSALWPIDRAHRATRRHARYRLRRPSGSLQGHHTAAAQRAARRLDQSTQKGHHTTDHHTQLLAKLVNKCVSSPLTRSGEASSTSFSCPGAREANPK